MKRTKNVIGKSIVHKEYLSLLSVPRSVWGHSVHFQFLTTLDLLLTYIFMDLCTAMSCLTGILLSSK